MAKQFLFFLFLLISLNSFGQDTTKRIFTRVVKRTLDTNRIFYNEQGKPLHYYQYQHLLNTGEYTLKPNGMPDDPNTKIYLRKLTEDEKINRYDQVKSFMAVKSPKLKEGIVLDVNPLSEVISSQELNRKVIVLIFWAADCPPCTESFADLNAFLKQMHNPEDLVLLAITPDATEVANAKLKEKPLLYTQLLSNAKNALNQYQLKSYPSFVVTDKDHVIRYAVSGMGPYTLPSFESAIKTVLFQ